MSVFKEKAKDFASAGLNKLPDRANLFLRYITGIGGRNLDLDDKTVSQIRDSTKESTATGEPGGRFGFEPDESLGGMKPKISFETFKSDKPRSGVVNPYYNATKDPTVAHTLGRFTAKVNADKGTVNVKDKYDMVNEYEDPDLVSGKIQPKKAFNEIKGIFNKNKSVTGTTATRLARAGMYLSPTKPKAFGIDIDIPLSGDINNRESYN
tara:strand:- start:80 stop:706 length:627 start_codon:yes stop_codon:yes gene_type:complete